MPHAEDAVDWDRPPTGLDTIAAELRGMREAAGSPSYEEIGRRVIELQAARGVPEHRRQGLAKTTVWASFQQGRRRLDAAAVADIAAVLGLPEQLREPWAQRVRLARSATDGAAVAVVRHEPPAPVPSFTGRQDALARTTAALAVPTRLWLTGMGGAGKTQLALKTLADLRAEAVFLDLRGKGAGALPVDPDAAQRAVLRQLDVDETTARTPQERATLIRHTLASRRAVLLLDDASGVDQVDRIVGQDPACAVLVTSRARPGDSPWTVIEVDGLDAQETATLLATLSAGSVVDGSEAERLIEATGGLPLAVALVGARLATHPTWTLAEHIDLMAERVATARVDDDIRASLALSYTALDADATLLLRAFADLPVAELDADAAAAVLDGDRDRARKAIAELVDASVAVRRDDRHIGLHALVRAFGRERAEETDPPRLRSATFGRVARTAAERTWAAYATLARATGDRARSTAFVYPEQDWSEDEARAWLRRELPSLLALAHAAPDRGHPELLFRLSEGLSWWMTVAGYVSEAVRLHEAAMDTAILVGDDLAAGKASGDAGQLLLFGDDLDTAQEYFDRAMSFADESSSHPDPRFVGLLLNQSAMIDRRQGRPEVAKEKLERATRIHEELDDKVVLTVDLLNLSITLHTLGLFDEEEAVIARGLRIAEEIGHRLFEANLRVNQSTMLIRQGLVDQAVETTRIAKRLGEELEYEHILVYADSHLGVALGTRGDLDEAVEVLEASLERARAMAQAMITADTLIIAAPWIARAGDADRARDMLREAEELLPFTEHMLHGQILHERSKLADDAGDRDALRRAAVERFDQAGCYLADEVRAELAAG